MVIRQPKKALPASYRPTGGLPYKVGERDSWSSVAAKHGVDPLWLVQYNFETRDPAEVNWYLKHRIGCRKTTANGKNLMFSSADAPGIIYVPNPQKPWSRKNLKYGSYGIVIPAPGLVAGDPNLAKSLQGVKSSFNPFVESL